MRDKRRFRRIDVDLDGIIRFQQTNDTIECVVCNVSEKCMGFMIVTSDSRVCKREDLNLSVFIPTEGAPAKCTGRVVWYSEDRETFRGRAGYSAGIFTTHINRTDSGKLDLLIARNKAFSSSGYGRRFSL